MNIVSFFSFLSLFVFSSCVAERSALIEESQPTRCGHTLRGVPCRGWRVRSAPRPLKRQKGKSHEAAK